MFAPQEKDKEEIAKNRNSWAVDQVEDNNNKNIEKKHLLSTFETEEIGKKDNGCNEIVPQAIICLLMLYTFIVGLKLIGTSMKVLSGPSMDALFEHIKGKPLEGLATGILATVLVQSSSTTTAITVVLAGLEKISVSDAVPVIFGANIGTSVTSSLIALVHIKAKDVNEYPRAFAGAVVSDVFNFLGVMVFLPLHLIIKAFSTSGVGLFDGVTALLVAGVKKSKFGKIKPIKIITGPVIDLFLKLNKKVYVPLTEAGRPTLESKHPFVDDKTGKTYFGIDYEINNNATKLAIAERLYDKHVANGSLIKGGILSGCSNTVGGFLGLLIALTIVICSLLVMVSALKKITFGKARKSIMKALDMNAYLAVIIGIIATLAVQSSSIVTSTLVPLVAVGSLRLDKSLPMCIGSNIGTCGTAMIAALASDDIRLGFQIALVHLFFNLFTFVTFFPIEKIRNVPLGIAKQFGKAAAVNKSIPFMYMGYCYILSPAILFFCGFHNGGFLSWILLPFICIIPFGLWRKFIYNQAAEIEIDFENRNTSSIEGGNEEEEEEDNSYTQIL